MKTSTTWRAHALAMALAAMNACADCRAPNHEPAAFSAEPPAAVADIEIAWSRAKTLIKDQQVRWLVPTYGRRLFITTTEGREHATTAPTEESLNALLETVDRSAVGVPDRYVDYRQIPWSEVSARVRGRLVSVVHQNGARRVLLETMDDEGFSTERYVTIQPAHDDVKAAIPRRHPNGYFVKFFDFHETPWAEAVALVRSHRIASVFIGHRDYLIFKGTDDRDYLTSEPRAHEATALLAREAPALLEQATIE